MRQLFWGCLDTMSAYKRIWLWTGQHCSKDVILLLGKWKEFFSFFQEQGTALSWCSCHFMTSVKLFSSETLHYYQLHKKFCLVKKPAHLFFDMRKKWKVNSDKNPLTRTTRTPHLKQGSLDHGLKFPLSCNVENPFYFKVPLGSGKICTAQLAATVCFLCTN